MNGSKGEESMAHIVNLRHAPALRAALDGKAEHGGIVRIDRRSQLGKPVPHRPGRMAR